MVARKKAWTDMVTKGSIVLGIEKLLREGKRPAIPPEVLELRSSLIGKNVMILHNEFLYGFYFYAISFSLTSLVSHAVADAPSDSGSDRAMLGRRGRQATCIGNAIVVLLFCSSVPI
jgi:hypothetical protein